MKTSVLALALTMTSSMALAAPKHAHAHHCMTASGAIDAKVSKKECLAGKGTWEKAHAAAKTAALPKSTAKKAQ